MSLITNQKIKKLESEIEELKTLVNSLATPSIPEIIILNGFNPTASFSYANGVGRSASYIIRKDNQPLSNFVELPAGAKITCWYGLSAYRANGTVGTASFSFQLFNTYTNSWKNINCPIKFYLDPTQNQETKTNSTSFVLTEPLRFKEISIFIYSSNTVMDGSAYPYWTCLVHQHTP